jgi:hypothetical protein
MAKSLPLCLALASGLAACSGDPPPKPDPQQVREALARLESRQSQPADAWLSRKQRTRLHQAERLVAPLEKVQPDRIDPALAAALIAG